MMNLPYDKTDSKSIIQYAKKLIGHTLSELCSQNLTQDYNHNSKGKFGNMLEKAYFMYAPNSKPICDFSEAKLELKSTPLKKLIGNKKYVAKERLVLDIINYNEIINQTFTTSTLFIKNKSLLLVCYLYEEDKHFLDYVIHLVDKWQFSDDDIAIIKQDWKIIKDKVLNGKAHEISESDTLYLAACTKGKNSDSLRTQPFSSIPAKQRAYSLKQSYLNYIIKIISGNKPNYGKLLSSSSIIKKQTFEDYVLSKFNPYIGMNISDILYKLNIKLSNSKDYYARLSKSIMNIDPAFEIEEFVKADIKIKTVRININGSMDESISFPSFKYKDILDKTWEDSLFNYQISRKFMFVFYKITENGDYKLDKVKFWNMPIRDVEQVRLVWENVYDSVSSGCIVKKIENGKRYTNFIKSTQNPVSHIRPHATTKNDTYPLPIKDKLTGATEYTKHCLWLNKNYIINNIYH